MIRDDAAAESDAAEIALQGNDPVAALSHAKAVHALAPSDATLELVGRAQLANGLIRSAIATLHQVVLKSPQQLRARLSLVVALQHAGSADDMRDASRHLLIATLLNPALAEIWAMSAVHRHFIQAPDRLALVQIDRAARLDPANADIWLHAARMMYDWGDFLKSDRAVRCALSLSPARADIVHALAETVAASDVVEALPWFDRLVGLEPGAPRFRVARGMNRLAAGQAGGWDDYEYRRFDPMFGIPAPAVAETDIRSLAGKTVMVLPEQGFGDVIQFVRFVPLLAELGATVLLVARPQLRTLFAASPVLSGKVLLIGHDEVGKHRADLILPIMSLPRFLGATFGGGAYLAAAPEQRARWKLATAELSGLRVGLCWSGSTRAAMSRNVQMVDYRRSLQLKQLGPALGEMAGLSLVSLQISYREGDSPRAYGIRDASAYLRDFGDLAGLIANLDLVITVDTAVAHLAGAMGVATWMLSRLDSCWRWGRVGSRTPWYESMTIYRQDVAMQWDAPIAAVVRDLRSLIGKSA